MKKEDEGQIMKAIEAVGIPHLKNRNIGEFSGGQQQRVFIAINLVSSLNC